MNRTYVIAAGLLGLAAAISIGLWMTGFPPEWDTDKGERISSVRNFLTTPLAIVGVGTVLSAVIAWFKRGRLTESGKVKRIAMMGVLFMPILTLFLQIVMPLMIYDVIDDRGADYALAGLMVLFFLVMGNYIVTAPFEGRIGFRNKWTLSDPVIWSRTHRFLGRGLVFGALLTVPLMSIVPSDYAFYLPILMAVMFKVSASPYARSLSQRLALRNT